MPIEKTHFDNGLPVYTDNIDSVETVTVGLWINAGARQEKAENNGIAHFLEHMAFKGTASRNARQIAEEIESAGGFMNAWTAREQTAYYVRVPRESLGVALDILSDILINPVFDAKEMERERGVIIQEIGRTHDTPDDLVFDLFQETAFPDQPLGRPILGSVETVKAMTRDHLTDYLSAHYGPRNSVLAASGRVNLEEFSDLSKSRFAGFAGGNGAVKAPAKGQYRGGLALRKRKEIEQTHIVLGLPAPHYHDERYYQVKILSSLMGQGMSSRLFQEIREKRGLAYSIFSFSFSMQDCGLFGIYAGTGPEQVGELMEGIAHCLEEVANSVSEEELQRAKTLARSGLLMAMESPSSRAQQMARQILIYGNPITVEEQIKKINAVSRENISELMRDLYGRKATLSAISPDSKTALDPGLLAQRFFSFAEN